MMKNCLDNIMNSSNSSDVCYDMLKSMQETNYITNNLINAITEKNKRVDNELEKLEEMLSSMLGTVKEQDFLISKQVSEADHFLKLLKEKDNVTIPNQSQNSSEGKLPYKMRLF